MSEHIVEVGPTAIRGSADVPAALATTALEHLDDDVALLDGHPVAVDAVWREVFRAALPKPVESAVLVCPTWWSPQRVERIREAAGTRSATVVVRRRAEALAAQMPGNITVVEIASDLAAVSRDGQIVAATARVGEHTDVADAVIIEIGRTATVLLDAPADVAELAGAIAERLRADGITAMMIPPDRVLHASRQPLTPRVRAVGRSPRRMPRTLVSAALVATLLVCVGLGIDTETDAKTDGVPVTLLVEGRVGMKVPALWQVRRISSGPGSARVEVSAPDLSAMVLMTQSQVATGEALASTAATLRSALDDQPPGVFREFDPEGRRADRAAVTYREVRDERETEWVVFVDGAVRIGIGCQSALGEQDRVRLPCEEAVRSAHALT